MKLLGTQDRVGWESVLDRLASAGLGDIYFDAAYVSLYEGNGVEAQLFVFEEGPDTFCLPYLKRTLPENAAGRYDMETAYGYAGPLATTEDGGFLGRAWAGFRQHAAETGLFAGFLRFHPLLRTERFAPAPFVGVEYVRDTVCLGLQQDEERIWQQYRSDTRTRIRKARKSGIEVEHLRGVDSLLVFGSLYRQAMTHIGADSFYRFDDEYFRAVDALPHGSYDLFLARRGEERVGGALTLSSSRFAHMHLSATLREARSLGVSHLLRHEAILHYRGKREMFHFGGGTTNDPRDSLLRFKAGFSPERCEFRIGKLILDVGVYRTMCEEWEVQHPDRAEAAKGIFLKYRL